MNSVVCNLCGQDDWTVRFPATLRTVDELTVDAFRCTSPDYGHHAQIVECRHCGYVYANPRWSGDSLTEAYAAVEDEMYVQERAGRELTFRKHLQKLEQFTGPAAGRSLLDVGAYIGVFVEVATAAGWDACGIEPSAWAVREAQARGLAVREGTQATLAGEQYDVVTMWDVIEHVPDPKHELQQAFQLLKPGGILAVHTMDIDSLLARLLGPRWPWLMEMHIHYFSRRTLTQMLRDCGFEIVWAGPQGRYLRLGYVATRLNGFHTGLGRLATRFIHGLNLAERAIPLNFGDLFTVFARRPQ